MKRFVNLPRKLVPQQRTHPTREDLTRFLWDALPPRDAERLANHLAACPRCSGTADTIPAPLVFLGRPFLPFLPWSAERTEEELATVWLPLLRESAARTRRGETLDILVGGSMECEGLIHQIISLSLSRLRAEGFRVAFTHPSAEPSDAEAKAEVLAVLDAPIRVNPLPPARAQLRILVGWLPDWQDAGATPALTIAPEITGDLRDQWLESIRYFEEKIGAVPPALIEASLHALDVTGEGAVCPPFFPVRHAGIVKKVWPGRWFLADRLRSLSG
jgi:hypothetical protein